MWPAKAPSEFFMKLAQSTFKRFGALSGTFRERGFICVVFKNQNSAQKALNAVNNQSVNLNGVNLGKATLGIPKKSHKNKIGELCGSKRKFEATKEDVQMKPEQTAGGTKSVW